jgi:hypothetical protein
VESNDGNTNYEVGNCDRNENGDGEFYKREDNEIESSGK